MPDATAIAWLLGGTLMGKCHICRQQPILVRFCRKCDHWFCEDCRVRYWDRGIEAVKELVGGRSPGCCGVAANA